MGAAAQRCTHGATSGILRENVCPMYIDTPSFLHPLKNACSLSRCPLAYANDPARGETRRAVEILPPALFIACSRNNTRAYDARKMFIYDYLSPAVPHVLFRSFRVYA